MHLINFPKVRIKMFPVGYIVQIQKRKWYGRKYWTHISAISGMDTEPWFYSSFDIALSETIKYFKWDILNESEYTDWVLKGSAS